MNSTSSTLDFCLRKDLGRYLCLYWDYSRCQRVYPCLLVSNTMDVLPGIVNTLSLSHQLRGVLVIPVTGAGELGLYNYWRWFPLLSFRLWLVDISQSDLRSLVEGNLHRVILVEVEGWYEVSWVPGSGCGEVPRTPHHQYTVSSEHSDPHWFSLSFVGSWTLGLV